MSGAKRKAPAELDAMNSSKKSKGAAALPALAIPTTAAYLQDREPTGFAKLPRELRDQIYGYYFETVHPEEAEHEINLSEACRKKNVPFWDITLACKQIRHETLPLYRELSTEFWERRFSVDIDLSWSTEELEARVAIFKNLLVGVRRIHHLRFDIHWHQSKHPRTNVFVSLLRGGISMSTFGPDSEKQEHCGRGPLTVNEPLPADLRDTIRETSWRWNELVWHKGYPEFPYGLDVAECVKMVYAQCKRDAKDIAGADYCGYRMCACGGYM